MEKLLSIFSSQIRRLSNKKMCEINCKIQHMQTSAENGCLPFCSGGKKEARGENRTGLMEAASLGLALHATIGVYCSLGPCSRKGWTLPTSPGDAVIPCPFPRRKIELLLLVPSKTVTGQD